MESPSAASQGTLWRLSGVPNDTSHVTQVTLFTLQLFITFSHGTQIPVWTFSPFILYWKPSAPHAASDEFMLKSLASLVCFFQMLMCTVCQYSIGTEGWWQDIDK